jgi:hypothetical protein
MKIDAQTHNALNGVRRDNDPGPRDRRWQQARTIMEDTGETLSSKRLYLLTQEDCDELRNIHTMMIVMRQVSAGHEDGDKDLVRPKPARSEISRFLAEASAKVGRVLDRARAEGGKFPR